MSSSDLLLKLFFIMISALSRKEKLKTQKKTSQGRVESLETQISDIDIETTGKLP